MADRSEEGTEGRRSLRLLICGGRDYNNWAEFNRCVDNFLEERGHLEPEYQMPVDVKIIHGNAKGADSLADQYAVVNWTGLEVYPAKWEEHGKAAGIIRNKQMLDEGKPDVVLAFPGGRGTAHMKRIARERGIEVVEACWADARGADPRREA